MCWKLQSHSQRWNKILISEYDFAVNAVIDIHDLVNKLLITKISPAKILIFSML